MSNLNCCEELLILRMGGDQIIWDCSMLLKLFIPACPLQHYHTQLYPIQNMFKYSYLPCLLLTCLLITATADSCSSRDDELFISFHPHLDAFWLNTDDQLKDINFRPEGFLYVMNQRNAKVIFNSMLDGLLGSPLRKYFVTEIVFFKDWYDVISQKKQNQVKALLKNGQLEITNGGWVENDEAVCYVDDIIDQYTVGHNWLDQEFGLSVKVAWATDSFGHSHSQAAIEHLLGIQTQGIERIDDRYIFKRKNGSLLQFYWSAVSDSNGHKYGGVFTHIRHFLHEFVNYRQTPPTSIADDHVSVSNTIKKLYRRNKMFRFVGNDFEEFIPAEFQTLEKAMKDFNNRKKKDCDTFKWGNPSDYFKLVAQDNVVPVREGDFIPNYDQDHYWSGYYTTNPELKIICKDYSRLVNLFRKVYLKHQMKGEALDFQKLFDKAEELLAIMQHHDGITATSKYYIEELFKNRMRDAAQQIITAIKKLKSIDSVVCSLYNGGNKCKLPQSGDSNLYLTILHEGAPKVERIELTLPAGQFYEAEQDTEDNIFCRLSKDCTLVFNAEVVAGQNHFLLNRVEESAAPVKNWVKASGLNFQGKGFSVDLGKNHLSFTIKGEPITLSLMRSPNQASQTQTTTWTKFGSPIEKSERRMPGIYIMANSGQIDFIPEVQFQNFWAVAGTRYSKVGFSCRVGNIEVTIDNQAPNLLQVEATFKPTIPHQFDYFVKVDSALKPNGVFYHDMNGMLVSKRKVGERLDYEWIYKKEDKINANTYPMCSFGYIIDGQKKLVVFTDRAQGLTLYDDSLLINIDRLTGDDYKGAGEGYNRMIENTFKFKIGLTTRTDHIERKWQREYDQTLLGFVSDHKPQQAASRSRNSEDDPELLKYTVFRLNKEEFVVRLYNLNEESTLEVPKYGQKEWNLSRVGWNLQFADLKESFANGMPLDERRIWKVIPGQINVFSAGSKDTPDTLVLQPLQIRSFRINLKRKIKTHHYRKPEEALADVQVSDVQPVKSLFLRRCF